MAPAPFEVALQAAVDGNLRLLRMMANKVDLRVVKDSKGKNVLHLAAANGRLEICKFLVEEWGLDVNSLFTEGETTMHMVLQYFLDHGVDPATTTSRGSTLLHEAAENGHCEATMLLLSKGVPVDPLNHQGTPLHLAVAKDQDGTAKVLLEHGVDPNRVVHHVFSPLLMACCAPAFKCMKLLVEHGRIPIMRAAHSGRRELVEILFPQTKRVPFLPDWSVDGIIRTMKYMPLDAQESVSVEERIADEKAQGKEAVAKGNGGRPI